MGKINVHDKIMIENQKKRENMEIKEILYKSPSKDRLQMEFSGLLKRADARESADIIYLICDTYRYSMRIADQA